MSIEDIKDINKLYRMLKDEMRENKYLKSICDEAGELLSKDTFDYDMKEKTLLSQIRTLLCEYNKITTQVDTLKSYIKYMKAFNNANKCNKGLDIENVENIFGFAENDKEQNKFYQMKLPLNIQEEQKSYITYNDNSTTDGTIETLLKKNNIIK